MLARGITAIGLLLFAGCTHDPLVVRNVYPGLVAVQAPEGELTQVLFSADGMPAQQGFLYTAMFDAGVAGQNASLARAAADRRGGKDQSRRGAVRDRPGDRPGMARQGQRHRRGVGRLGLRPPPLDPAHDRRHQGGARARQRIGCAAQLWPARHPVRRERAAGGGTGARRSASRCSPPRRMPSSTRSCASWTRRRPPSTMACRRPTAKAAGCSRRSSISSRSTSTRRTEACRQRRATRGARAAPGAARVTARNALASVGAPVRARSSAGVPT